MADLQKRFSKIYDQYINKIYRFVFLKVNSQEIAQDLCSETFLQTFKSLKKNNIENPQAFLYRVARNLITDYYRQKGRIQITLVESNPVIGHRENLEEKAMLTSDINRVRLTLNSLKEDYQNVIIWHYLDDLSISELAKMLDKPEGTTRVILHRALKALKNTLNQ